LVAFAESAAFDKEAFLADHATDFHAQHLAAVEVEQVFAGGNPQRVAAATVGPEGQAIHKLAAGGSLLLLDLDAHLQPLDSELVAEGGFEPPTKGL